MEIMFVPNLQEESRICNVVVPSSPVERRAQALKDLKNYQQTGRDLVSLNVFVWLQDALRGAVMEG